MKKYAILLLAGSVIGLSSCGNESNTTTQEQIDSAVDARTSEMEAQLRAQNDSLINAMAMMKADSAARADSMAAVSAGRPVPPRPATSTARTTRTTRPATTPPKTQEQKVNDLFDKNKSEAQKAKEVKQEEKKVNDLFNK